MFFKMEHCDVYYGQIQALYDINVEINPGEIISIIGANGAGKTTLMKSIMGLVPAKNGKIVWQDEEIQARKQKTWQSVEPEEGLHHDSPADNSSPPSPHVPLFLTFALDNTAFFLPPELKNDKKP